MSEMGSEVGARLVGNEQSHSCGLYRAQDIECGICSRALPCPCVDMSVFLLSSGRQRQHTLLCGTGSLLRIATTLGSFVHSIVCLADFY